MSPFVPNLEQRRRSSPRPRPIESESDRQTLQATPVAAVLAAGPLRATQTIDAVAEPHVSVVATREPFHTGKPARAAGMPATYWGTASVLANTAYALTVSRACLSFENMPRVVAVPVGGEGRATEAVDAGENSRLLAVGSGSGIDVYDILILGAPGPPSPSGAPIALTFTASATL